MAIDHVPVDKMSAVAFSTSLTVHAVVIAVAWGLGSTTLHAPEKAGAPAATKIVAITLLDPEATAKTLAPRTTIQPEKERGPTHPASSLAPLHNQAPKVRPSPKRERDQEAAENSDRSVAAAQAELLLGAKQPLLRTFTMSVSSHMTSGGSVVPFDSVVPTGQATAAYELGSDRSPYPEAGVSTGARLRGSFKPGYPTLARDDGREADVELSIVVSQNGTVLSAKVTQSAGYGFDEAALRAVRQARFTPARKDGGAVAVRMRWHVSFRLQ